MKKRIPRIWLPLFVGPQGGIFPTNWNVRTVPWLNHVLISDFLLFYLKVFWLKGTYQTLAFPTTKQNSEETLYFLIPLFLPDD